MVKARERECYVTIHQICGDCGKRIIEKIVIPDESDKEGIKKFHHLVIKCYGTKFNMACAKCSNKIL